MAKITIEIPDKDLAMLEDYINTRVSDEFKSVNELLESLVHSYSQAMYRPRSNEYQWYSNMLLIKNGVFYHKEY